MPYRILADGVVLIHFAFIAFCVFGGLLTFRWPRVTWLHVPAAVWGVAIALAGRTCPLTPLENWLRRSAGQPGYRGGFIFHYLLPIIYPASLTRTTQVLLGSLLLLVNASIYWIAWRRGALRRSRPAP